MLLDAARCCQMLVDTISEITLIQWNSCDRDMHNEVDAPDNMYTCQMLPDAVRCCWMLISTVIDIIRTRARIGKRILTDDVRPTTCPSSPKAARCCQMLLDVVDEIVLIYTANRCDFFFRFVFFFCWLLLSTISNSFRTSTSTISTSTMSWAGLSPVGGAQYSTLLPLMPN